MLQKSCSRCDVNVFRRISRQGWWQRTVLTRLGLYPWECVHCRTRHFFRDSGRPPGRDQPPSGFPDSAS